MINQTLENRIAALEQGAAVLAWDLDQDLIKKNKKIRLYRWECGQIVYQLKRKPNGFNEGDSGYDPYIAEMVKPMYQYADSTAETWEMYCESPLRPSRQSCHKWELLHTVYTLQYGISPYSMPEVLEASIDRLSTSLAIYLRDVKDQEVVLEALQKAAELDTSEWDVWRHNLMQGYTPPKPAPKGEKPPRITQPVTLYETAHNLSALAGLHNQFGNKQTLKIVAMPVSADYADENTDILEAVFVQCEKILRRVANGEQVDSDEIQLALNTIALARNAKNGDR